MFERTSVGLDVHARSVAACALDSGTGEIIRRSLAPDETAAWLSQLPGPVAVTYEAGPTGFWLARTLAGAGIECQVAAPSRLLHAPGDRIKTDKRDAFAWPGCSGSAKSFPCACPPRDRKRPVTSPAPARPARVRARRVS
jgi:hypothetical protein